MTRNPPCRLWDVGTWREVRQIGGEGRCFSPDGRLLAVQDASKVIRLVETQTGRTVARLESPDLCSVVGSLQPRRVAAGGEHPRWPGRARLGPAGHPRTSRRDGPRLGRAGLFRRRPGRAIGPAAAPAPGRLWPAGRDTSSTSRSRPRRCSSGTPRASRTIPPTPMPFTIAGMPWRKLKRTREAIDDFTRAIRLRPVDAHLRASRGESHAMLQQHEPAIADLEAALALEPGRAHDPKPAGNLPQQPGLGAGQRPGIRSRLDSRVAAGRRRSGIRSRSGHLPEHARRRPVPHRPV